MFPYARLSLLFLALSAAGFTAGCAGEPADEPEGQTGAELGTEGVTAADVTFRDGFVYRGPNDECTSPEGGDAADTGSSSRR